MNEIMICLQYRAVLFNTLSITNILVKVQYVGSSKYFLRMISYLVSSLNDSAFNLSK